MWLGPVRTPRRMLVFAGRVAHSVTPHLIQLTNDSVNLCDADTKAPALTHPRQFLRCMVVVPVVSDISSTLRNPYVSNRAHHQHHLHVCTPVDYTCAPKGMSFYSYFLPYFACSYAEAWQLAIQECDRAGKPRYSHHNTTLVAVVVQALLAAMIYAIFGPVATAVHVTSNIVLLVYMATLDYILHYGLVRPPMPGNERRKHTHHAVQQLEFSVCTGERHLL
ncbi:hypothetical protein Vretifemale_7176 [Volvox reticuliferus]|nr:hypothetical protein Vretifemale_7176 [Volvox reticuliferus]